MPDWKDEIELSGKHAIVLTRKLLYADSMDEYEYELLSLFRLNETSKWSIDCPLMNMVAGNFDPKDYDGFVLIENK
jgi:hypothetical protein